MVYAAHAQATDAGATQPIATEFDSRVVGKWVAILSLDGNGQGQPERFEVEYLADGKARFDREAIYRKFNQRRVQSGYAPLTPKKFNHYFPRVTWKTTDNRIVLTFRSRLGTNELSYVYQVKGDTLTTVNETMMGTRSRLVSVRKSLE